MVQPRASSHATRGQEFRHEWDTSIVPQENRFAYFREGVCQAAFALTPEEPEDRLLDARMQRADLPRGFLSKVEISPHRALRTKADLSKIPGRRPYRSDIACSSYDSAPRMELASLFDAAISLLLAGLIRDEDFLEDSCAANGAVRVGLLQTIRQHIEKNIADPTLSTVRVAASFGISPRYIQKLFATAGMTFKHVVIDRRLDEI